ncbi:hypothetical protein [Nostoc sp. C110]|uniref:hypothetical protein n=1 Tax=Nostoc sp. C110 TaxID=3349876 RepID=UPI00370D2C09
MRKIIIILITSILGLEITSCARVGSQVVKEAGRTVGREVAEGAGRTAGREVAEGAGRTAGREVAEGAGRTAGREASRQFVLKRKIYDAAYKEALSYYELQGNQASQDIANQIAAKAASDTNQELGNVVGDVTVMTIAGTAATAAATDYQAKNQG